jgi:flagellar L-ring protein precursor FlgH
MPKTERTLGSLWSPGDLGELSSDYKARKVNDTVVILVSVQTTATQSGDVNSSRAFQTSSAITGLAGEINTKGLNPLFDANSSTALKGSGATDSSTTFQTSMTAQVIAVLPSGNLVVEAQRKIFMNNQHEDVTIRGVVRPNDIGTNNTVPSAALSNLEIEMKGKGIIADSTRPPNRITRALLWLLGF